MKNAAPETRPYALETAPGLPENVASMMMQAERDLLYSVAKNYYSGAGDIIDAGIFLGASTFCFSKGLEENDRTRGDGKIVSYEMARANRFMLANKNIPQHIRDRLGGPGDDFSDYLRSIVSGFGPKVELHCGDIIGKDYEGEVEILFLDILKTPAVFRKCNEMFMSRLIPGRSLVIQQDYYWFLDWWINAYMELAAEYFVKVDSADTSCAFVNVKALPESLTTGSPFEDLSHDEMFRLLDRSRAKAETLFQYMMSDLCAADYALNSKLFDECESRLQSFEQSFASVIENCIESQFGMRRVRNGFGALKNRLQRQKEEA